MWGSRHKRLPLCWMGNCVSGAAPALWAWWCCSADWQVRRRVTDKTARSAANGSAGGWGRIVTPLPGQPPLNECVRGMRPDGSYITGWRAGLRLWRGSDKGSSGERDFFFPLPFIYLYPSVALASRNSTKPKHSNMSPALDRKDFVEGKCWSIFRVKSVTNLFSFASVCDVYLSPHRVTHVIG